MKTEHYPSLELCKKLTEAGFPITELGNYEGDIAPISEFTEKYRIVYPSIAELLDELPRKIEKMEGIRTRVHHKYTLGMHDSGEDYRIFYATYNQTMNYVLNKSLPNVSLSVGYGSNKIITYLTKLYGRHSNFTRTPRLYAKE